MSAVTAPLVLVLFIIAAAVPPLPLWLRALAGMELLGLWFYWLRRERVGYRREAVRKNLLNLLPGHAVLLLGLGLVDARHALILWLALPPLTVLFDLAAHRAPRSIVAFLYAILWFGVFALIHQLIAVGKGLTGTGLLIWSAVIAFMALAYVGLGVLRIKSEKR